MEYDNVILFKNKMSEALNNLESTAKIELCTERGINSAREYAKANFSNCSTGIINKANICYASTCMSFNLFVNWWQETFNKEIDIPVIDKEIFQRCAAICGKCSPQSATGVGAGAGAIGGFLLGGIFGAAIGAALGGFGGAKATEEATGEKYYSILRESISTLYTYLRNEVSKMIDYSIR